MRDEPRESSAITALESAFQRKARSAAPDRPTLGVFGGDFPLALATAAGFATVDVEMEPDADRGLRDETIDAYVEPFVDRSARAFLHRLSCGAFEDLKAILFTRASPPAYLAYLYASEFKRQGLARWHPDILLWNFQLTRTAPAEAFNLSEARRLETALVAWGGTAWSEPRLRSAVADEADRRRALRALMERRSGGAIPGSAAMRWRNAGRYLSAKEHAHLLDEALAATADQPAQVKLRLELAGSPTASDALYRLIEEFGIVVADPHPQGQGWPPPHTADADLPMILRATAANPLDPRSLPVADHRQAVADACIEALCDLVVFQVDERDDCFGWDFPGIREALERQGIATLDLGLRPSEEYADWLDSAHRQIAAAATLIDRQRRP